MRRLLLTYFPASRMVVGWQTAKHLYTSPAVDALNMAAFALVKMLRL